ncbi:MAG TPA: type II secretion system protein N [Steroidobacteraceae bacterium]
MSAKTALLLATAVFVLTVLVRLPAGVVTPWLPAALRCQGVAGTVWHGSCAQVGAGSLALQDVRWTLQPLPLLAARAALDLQSNDARAAGHAQLVLHPGGDIVIRGLDATLPLQGGLSLLPPGWSGTLTLAVPGALIRAGHVAALEGVLTVRELRSEYPAADLGSFELDFPAPRTAAPPAEATGPGPAPIIGAARDLAGPLALQGVVKLWPDGRYELGGTLAARSAASPGLQQLVLLFGPPDAQGRHAFSLAGTY